MTAEIAVLNKFAIALAADSAITVDAFHKDSLRTKVYNSGNKLFTLSKFQPIGIMFYNGVTMGGIPWETLFKEFRRNLGRSKCDYLEQYCQSFFGWLTNNAFFLDENVKRKMSVTFIRQLVQFGGGDDAAVNVDDFLKNLEGQISRLEKLEDVPGFDRAFVDSAMAKYSDELKRAFEVALHSDYVAAAEPRLREFLALSLQKKEALDSYSGIVVAGFGEKEALPRLQHFIVDAIIDGKPRYWLRDQTEISESIDSAVYPLADAEAINTLLNGINPKFSARSIRTVAEVTKGLPEKILAIVAELDEAKRAAYVVQIAPTVDDLVKKVAAELRDYRQREYVSPILQAIASLPATELGVVAETLLGTAQILKRVNPDIETVGGPVDVAVITKGDGFVWIKRKHYFEAKLNPSFAGRYLED